VNFSFLPAEVKFYDYFEKASANLLDAAKLLHKLLEDIERLDEYVGQITEIEHLGDFIVHEVTNLLPRTLITPIDSEDIQRLVFSLDDAVDSIHAVATRMAVYQISEVKKPAIRLGELIVESSKELGEAIKGLRDKKQYPYVRERIVQINTIENNGDRILHDSLSNLVTNRNDLFEFICWKEIYEMLEETTDRIEDAGDVILKVMIENA